MTRIRRYAPLWLGVCLAACTFITLADSKGGSDRTVTLDIKAQRVGPALNEFAQQSGIDVLFYTEMASEVSTTSLVGTFTTEEALAKLLANTGLTFSCIGAREIAIHTVASDTGKRKVTENAPAQQFIRVAKLQPANDMRNSRIAQAGGNRPNPSVRREHTVEEIVVTGSRIRGVTDIAAPLSVITREDIESTGFQTIEQVLEATPQNFAGVHPASSDGAANTTRYSLLNTELATGIDLRGLGPDSTLVLLNGKRRATGGAEGRFVDISTIPLGAVDRLEIMTGGGSALYGSDAVAGVVNYVTRRSFDGLQSQVSYGGPTEYSGGQRLQTNHIFGHDFGRGGFMVAYDYRRDWQSDFLDMGLFPDAQSAAGQRFTDFPFQVDAERHSAIASGHLALSDRIELYADLLHSQRKSSQVQRSRFVNPANAGAGDSSTRQMARADEYTASAGLKVNELTGDWAIDIAGLYSRVSSPGTIDTVLDLGFFQLSQADNVERRNVLSSVSLVADGSLPRIGTITPRTAFGIEVRDESLSRTQRVSNASTTTERFAEPGRTVRSAFGELRLPLVEKGAGGVERLDITLGGRHDDYDDVGGIFNWTAGLIWQPARNVTLRGTYATSFHAPAFMDTEALAIGGTELRRISDPARGVGMTSPVLYLSGSGPVVPEEAQSWTLSLDYAPSFAPWANISLSYVAIDYDNRIAVPMTTDERLLALERAERFPELIQRNPTVSDIEAFLSRDADGLVGSVGLFPQWNPATGASGLLTAIPDLVLIDRRATNLAIETYRGLDLAFRGNIDTNLGRLSFGVNTAYMLERDNAVTPTSPVFSAMNDISRPVDLRVRANAGWTYGGLGAYLHFNYVDGYRNSFTVPESNVDSWITTDFTLRFNGAESRATGMLATMDVSLSIRNLLDREPPHVVTSPGDLLLTYDPANANPVGRYVVANLVKRW